MWAQIDTSRKQTTNQHTNIDKAITDEEYKEEIQSERDARSHVLRSSKMRNYEHEIERLSEEEEKEAEEKEQSRAREEGSLREVAISSVDANGRVMFHSRISIDGCHVPVDQLVLSAHHVLQLRL